MPCSIRYSFSQKFAVPATSRLLGAQIINPTIIYYLVIGMLIKDAFNIGNGSVEKEKRVHLYPERSLWISTRLSGYNKHSQFTYQIIAEKNGISYLDFTALHIEHKEISLYKK